MEQHRLWMALLGMFLFGPSLIFRAEQGAGAPRPAELKDIDARRMALTLRPSTLVDHIDELAGQHVRILNARVVGLFEPNAFLIESATRHLKPIGYRDRILVLIDAATLKVPAESIVASTVRVVGVARTLLGIQVTAEVPWPAKLDRDLIKRLEVRAAVLATSVQTAEGTELTAWKLEKSHP